MHQFKVQMHAGCVAGSAHGSDCCARDDACAAFDLDALEMGVERCPLVVVFDHDHVPVAMKSATGVNHAACVGGMNRHSAGAADINAFMFWISGRVKILSDAHGVDRPFEIEGERFRFCFMSCDVRFFGRFGAGVIGAGFEITGALKMTASGQAHGHEEKDCENAPHLSS